MTYVLKWTDPASLNPIITIADGTADITHTPLKLTGKGFLSWGLPLQQNLLYMLENYAFSAPPSASVLGQTWFNTTSSRLSVNVGTSGPDFQEFSYRDITLTPIAPQTSDLYYNNHTLSVFEGGWQPLAYSSQTRGNYSLDSGAVNHYVVALTPAISVYVNNFTGSFKVGITNTGGCTLDAGGGQKPLLTDTGVALGAGDLTTGSVVSYIFVYADLKFYITSIVKSQLDAVYAPLSSVTSGDVKGVAYASAPVGWLPCDGSSYATAAQPTLFAAIGYLWGGAGANFNVPDLRGRTLIGDGTGAGLTARTVGQETIGEETHLLATAEMPAHTHAFPHGTTLTGSSATFLGSGLAGNLGDISTNAAGGGLPHNNMQPSAVIHWVIKT
jgi:microcystin-dependent protein